jgi:flagellar basal body-associated protein FliL
VLLGILEIVILFAFVVILVVVIMVMIRFFVRGPALGGGSEGNVHQMRQEIDALRDEVRDLKALATNSTASVDRTLQLYSERLDKVESKVHQSDEQVQRLGNDV